jgi:hypothetical protein
MHPCGLWCGDVTAQPPATTTTRLAQFQRQTPPSPNSAPCKCRAEERGLDGKVAAAPPTRRGPPPSPTSSARRAPRPANQPPPRRPTATSPRAHGAPHPGPRHVAVHQRAESHGVTRREPSLLPRRAPSDSDGAGRGFSTAADCGRSGRACGRSCRGQWPPAAAGLRDGARAPGEVTC